MAIISDINMWLWQWLKFIYVLSTVVIESMMTRGNCLFNFLWCLHRQPFLVCEPSVLRSAQFWCIMDCKMVLDSVACNDVSFSENHAFYCFLEESLTIDMQSSTYWSSSKQLGPGRMLLPHWKLLFLTSLGPLNCTFTFFASWPRPLVRLATMRTCTELRPHAQKCK